MPTFIDLCSGAGLFSFGFQQAGFEPILAIDQDRLAIQSYNRNVAPVGIIGGVEKIIPDVHANLIIAGPPCQGFSTLGPRNPLDVRNRICMAVTKWTATARPEMVIVENVPPFLASSHWRQMADALSNLGYEIETWTLDAAEHGAPQHRSRSFTVASKIGQPNPPKKRRAKPSSIAFAPVRDGDEMHLWPDPTDLAAERIKRIPRNGDWRDILAQAPELCPPSWRSLGSQATDVWGRINADLPSNTLKTRFQNPSTGRYLHPTEDRVISLREGARLQGLTDDWVLCGNREAIVRQIGNGVPIHLGRAVARAAFAAVISAHRGRTSPLSRRHPRRVRIPAF